MPHGASVHGEDAIVLGSRLLKPSSGNIAAGKFCGSVVEGTDGAHGERVESEKHEYGADAEARTRSRSGATGSVPKSRVFAKTSAVRALQYPAYNGVITANTREQQLHKS